jgi:hypothetical protein
VFQSFLSLDKQFFIKTLSLEMKHCALNINPKKTAKFAVVTADIPRLKTAHMSKSHIKKVLIILFDIKGIVHFEFIPQSQMVNQTYYVEILKRLREAVHRKRHEL